MKTLLLCALLAALSLTAGCVRRYEVKLANQRTITSHGKPKFDKENNTFRFKDGEGRVHVVPSFNVREIHAR